MKKTLIPTSLCASIKSYIVRIDKVKYMEANMLRVGEKVVPVGPSYKGHVLKVFEE